jgi:hypothetical protein
MKALKKQIIQRVSCLECPWTRDYTMKQLESGLVPDKCPICEREDNRNESYSSQFGDQ